MRNIDWAKLTATAAARVVRGRRRTPAAVVVTVARGHRTRRGHAVRRTDLVMAVRRSLRLMVGRRGLVGLDGLAGLVTHRLDHRGLAPGRGTVSVLRRRQRAAAERHARQTRNHHLLDHLLHNAPCLSVA